MASAFGVAAIAAGAAATARLIESARSGRIGFPLRFARGMRIRPTVGLQAEPAPPQGSCSLSIETSPSERPRGKPRVLKQPAVRRAELVDCAQALFLTKGYERTTINDVIEATGLSKGAFYHHFRAKEDLLEAIAERFARQSLAFVGALREGGYLNALQQLNGLLALGRDWKLEHIRDLR